MLDLSPREVMVFAPMIAIVLWMGIYPSSFLKPMQPSVANLLERVQVSQHDAAPKLAIR
jgi:NADH-quinone oxidoreductase subunit M